MIEMLLLLKPIVEILFLWYVFYNILNFIRGTRAIQVLKALVLLLAIFLIAQRSDMRVLTWILNRIFAISVVALLIIFQPELRRGLVRLGGRRFLGISLQEEKNLDELIKAVTRLAQKKIGCIIAIQREVGLKPYIESGVILDSVISDELIEAIFFPSSSLHDGAVIIEGARIAAAGCLLPLTDNSNLAKTLGMRHRAAIGLTEESDAVVIIVSEENGLISLAERDKLKRDVDTETLRKTLLELYHAKEKKKTFLNRH